MTIDPHIPTMPARSMRVSPTRQNLLAPSAKRREVFGESRIKVELYPSKNRS